MNMDQLEYVENILIWLVPILYAITFHEVAHGWAARQCGDSTASSLGRLSLNPLKHIDLIGTVVVPITLLIFTGYVFGWAKPVPVNFSKLRSPRLHTAVVALAGPMANLLMIMGWILIARIAMNLAYNDTTYFFMNMASKGIYINLVLMLVNLIPIPPLDGGRVLTSALPPKFGFYTRRFEPVGILVLLALFMTGFLDQFQNQIFKLQVLLHNLAGL